MNKFAEEVQGNIRGEKRILARLAARNLTNKSPIDTGAYIRSMRVGINTIKTDYTPYEDADLPHLEEGQKESLREEQQARLLSEVDQVKGTFDSIHISNHIPYAKYVEYIGWKTKDAYHVFLKTYLRLSSIIKMRVKPDDASEAK